MKTVTVTMQYRLTDEWLSEVLITAFDANYGGCWYWCRPNPLLENAWEIQDGIWRAVNIVETDDAFPRISRVTHDTVAHGVARALQEPAGIVNSIRSAVHNDDPGEIDATGADFIIQYGLFGRLIYG